MPPSGRHGDALARLAAGHDDAHADEGAEDCGRRGPGGDRQLRDGADDPAALVRRPRAEVHCRRRFCGAALHRGGAHPRTDAIPAAPPAPIALCGSCRHRLENRRRIGRLASAACDSPRRQTKQHHVSADRRGSPARFRVVASRPASRSDAGGISRALRHRSVHVARAIARHSQRSEKRPVCSRCAAIFLFYGCTSLRPKRDDVRNAPSALARSGSSAPIEARLSAVAARGGPALHRDRTGMALSDRGATCFRLEPSGPSQTYQEIRATGTRSTGHGPAGGASTRTSPDRSLCRRWRGKSLPPRLSRSPSI